MPSGHCPLCHRLDSSRNKWRLAAFLPSPQSGHAAFAERPCDGRSAWSRGDPDGSRPWFQPPSCCWASSLVVRTWRVEFAAFSTRQISMSRKELMCARPIVGYLHAVHGY